MKMPPAISVYLNQNTSEFSLLSYALDPVMGVGVGCGDFKRLSSDEMKNDGLDIILKDFEEFPYRRKNKDEICELGRMSPKEQRKFKKEHKFVDISQNKENQLELAPMKRIKRGYAGCQVTIVSLPTTNEKFFETLMKVFEEC
jgi:hypothetical protein